MLSKLDGFFISHKNINIKIVHFVIQNKSTYNAYKRIKIIIFSNKNKII